MRAAARAVAAKAMAKGGYLLVPPEEREQTFVEFVDLIKRMAALTEQDLARELAGGK